jgi:hypothetical protein
MTPGMTPRHISYVESAEGYPSSLFTVLALVVYLALAVRGASDSSLHASVQFGSATDVLKYLDQLYRTGSHKEVNSFDENGWAPIHLAVGRERYISQLLVDHGADVLLATRDEAQETALHLTVRFGGAATGATGEDILSKIDALLEAGANANARSGGGETALHWAARAGEIHVMLKLLEAEANPNLQEYRFGRTPCHEAAIHGHPQVLEEIARFQKHMKKEATQLTSGAGDSLYVDCLGARDHSGKTVQDYIDLRRERRKVGQRTADAKLNSSKGLPLLLGQQTQMSSSRVRRYAWLQELQLYNYAETLERLGVDTPDDIAFLEEKDLTDIGIPLVKARKLLAFGIAHSRRDEL